MAINRCVFSGNLTRDAELRTTMTGSSVLNFSIALNEYRKNADDYVSYLDFVVFGDRAEKLQRHLVKGKKVVVEARARQNRWESNGQNRSKIEFIVDEIVFDYPKTEVYDEEIEF